MDESRGPDRLERMLERPWAWLILIALLAAAVALLVLTGARPLLAGLAG